MVVATQLCEQPIVAVAVDKAFKDAGVSKDAYDLNTDADKLDFVPKKPAAPKPEEKKK